MSKGKDAMIVIRIEAKERAALESEAKDLGLDLTSYVRHLLYTHQKRQRIKAK